jgi:hypothetical protein
MQDLIRTTYDGQDHRSDQIHNNARLRSHDPFMVLLYFDVNESPCSSHKTEKQKADQTLTTNNKQQTTNMNQINSIVTPSGTVISNTEIDRILGLGKRMKAEVAAAADKEAEDLVTTLTPSPTRKRGYVTPVMATMRTSVNPNKCLRGSSAAQVDFEDEPITPLLLNKAMAKSSDGVPASVLHQAPNKDLTGVSLSLTEVCATISHQIYKATCMESFHLSDSSHQAEVLYFHDHGFLKDSVPQLAIAVSGDALILAWRGSTTLLDWASDASYAPVSSSRWNDVAPNVRAHSAYTLLVESDLAIYEETIISEIRKRKLKQLILTGHSLAGGIVGSIRYSSV